MPTIFDNTACQLGEGPTYDQELDVAWWFDIEQSKLFEHDFNTGHTQIEELPFMASMVGIIDEENQLIATQNGLYLRNRVTSVLSLHQPLEADNPITRSNDGRVHPSGAIWIGTMGINGEDDAGAIYWFHKGELRKIYDKITVPNAICFSPDASTAYFTDTPTKKLMRVAVDPDTGFPVSEPSIFYDHTHGDGFQDGAIVDVEGNIWNACWLASNVIKISPDAKLLETHFLAAQQPTCPAFIGKDLDKLLVTSAFTGMSDKRLNKTPDSGKTFLMDVTVAGKPEPRVTL